MAEKLYTWYNELTDNSENKGGEQYVRTISWQVSNWSETTRPKKQSGSVRYVDEQKTDRPETNKTEQK